MNEIYFKKIVAKDGQRDEFCSSQEEFNNFVVCNIRPEFEDSDVLAVKFIFSNFQDFSEQEESSWFIHPDLALTFPEFSPEWDYGPHIAAEFPPELLLMQSKKFDIFKKYYNFYLNCLSNGMINLTDAEKLYHFEKFLESQV